MDKNLVIYICLIALLPILLLIAFLEKRARRVLVSYAGGLLVCLSAYYLNTAVARAFNISTSKYSVTFAPIVEEFLKFIPLLLFNLILRKGKRQTVAFSFALGVGFSVFENFFYLFNYTHSASIIWVILRCIGTGLMHSMTTTIIGFGLYQTRDRKLWSIIYGIASYIIAILYHLIYNFLVSESSLQVFGILLPIVSYIALFIFVKKDILKEYFKDDPEEEKQVK